MGKKGPKVYAVRVGRKPGIYSTWEECQQQTTGFPGATFKSFSTDIEANSFINGTSNPLNIINMQYPNNMRENIPIAPHNYSIDRMMPPQKRKMSNIGQDDMKRRFEDYQLLNRGAQAAQKKNAAVDQAIIKKLRQLFDDPNYERPAAVCNAMMDLPHAIRLQCQRYLNLTYEDGRVVVYIKGCCKLSPENDTIAGYGVFWGPNCFLNDSEKYEGNQSENHADVAAVMQAVRTAHKCGMKRLMIRTASGYNMMSMSKVLQGWSMANWESMYKGPEKNGTLMLPLWQLSRLILATKIDVAWTLAKLKDFDSGHEEAMRLASLGAYLWVVMDVL